MKLLIVLLLFSLTVQAQINSDKANKWHLDHKKYLTGGFVLVAGASKGFNETLMFHWKAFRHSFPKVNAEWFNPNVSWRNKYKDGNPDAGAKFPLSTSVIFASGISRRMNCFSPLRTIA